MLTAYRESNGRLERLALKADLSVAIWIDLFQPDPGEVTAVEALGLSVPSLADMEEIEISNRLYREEGRDYVTAVLPGHSTTRAAMAGPVTFILGPDRLVTVRHHVPRPFETFAERAERSTAGCTSPERVFLGLIEEIIARLADLLEGGGRVLDTVARDVYGAQGTRAPVLQEALVEVGRQGELLSRVRIGLLTLGRALGHVGLGAEAAALKEIAAGLGRDIQALEVHADFLGARVALISDATLGMINLAQSATVRIVSVVAVIFLPPTLIASSYGMNFARMPELDWAWGYPLALGLMLASEVGTFLFFRWRNWL